MEARACLVAPNDWERRTIADSCTRITSGGTPSRRRSNFFEDGTWPWVKTQELRDGWIDDTAEHITEEALQASSAKVLPANTLLVAMYGATVGQLGILRRPMTCNQACCALVVNEQMTHFRYLYYQLLFHRSQLQSLAVGAAQQNLSLGAFRSMRFPFPEYQEQRAIASILGALDDKIELNRRMNESLEAVARAIFKSWFVDFDPVRAKAEGRQPVGMDAETAALFPDAFEETELGEVPARWRHVAVGDLVELQRNTLDPQSYPDECFDHYSIPAYDEDQQPKVAVGETIKSGKFLVPAEAVLISKLNPRIPRVWMPALSERARAICSTEFFVTIGRVGVPRSFWYALATSRPFTDRFGSLVTGTSGSHQRVRPEHFLTMPAVIPNALVMQEFSTVVDPLLQRVSSNREESRTLAQVRDTLLPKLLLGEVRVDSVGPIEVLGT